MLTSSLGLGVNSSNSYFTISGGLSTRKFLSINTNAIDSNSLGLIFNAQTNLNFSGTTTLTFPSGTSTVITTNNITNNILPVTLDNTNKKIGINNASPSATLDIVQGTGNTSSVSFLIKLVASQSANSVEIKDSTNTLLFSIDTTGVITASGYKSQDGTAGITATQNGLVFKNGLYTAGTTTAITSLLPVTLDNPNKKIGINNVSPSATLDIIQGIGNTTAISLLIKGTASQSSDYLNIKNSSNTTLLNIDSSGVIQSQGYKSSDGTPGATVVNRGSSFKNGLMVDTSSVIDISTYSAGSSFTSNRIHIITTNTKVDYKLPVSGNNGDIIEIIGQGTGGWRIVQNTGQQIIFGNTISSIGTGGYIESTHRYDTIEIFCINLNLWIVKSAIGSLDVV